MLKTIYLIELNKFYFQTFIQAGMFVQPVEVMNTTPQLLGPLAGLNTQVSDFHLCVFVMKIIFSIFSVSYISFLVSRTAVNITLVSSIIQSLDMTR